MMKSDKKFTPFKNLRQSCKDFFRNPALYFDRSFSSSIGKQIGWFMAVFLIVLFILYAIYCFLPGEGTLGERFSNLLILLIGPTESDKMPVVFTIIVDFLGLIILSGLLITVACNILDRRVEAYQNGEISYKLKDHIIIIGYNPSVPSLVKTLRTEHGSEDEETFILIQSGQDATEVRSSLQIALDDWMVKNTVVLHGMSNSEEELRDLNIAECKAVYIIGDDTMEAHDSINLDSLVVVSKLWREAHPDVDPEDPSRLKNRLFCKMLFEHQTLSSVFQFSKLKKEVSGAIHFHPFNLYDNWAKKILVAGASDKESTYKPIEGYDGIRKGDTQHVHMIIIGMSRMGTALAVETAQTAHYPNFTEDDDTTRTHITFIDCNAQEEMESFKSRTPNVFEMMRWRYVDTEEESKTLYSLSDESWVNPIEEASSPYHHLGPNFTDIQWEFINGRVESAPVRQYLTDAANDPSAITTIAICLPNDQQAAQTALYLPDQALRNAYQVLVYQKESDAIIKSVNNPDDDCTKYDKLIPFGLNEETYCNDLIGEDEGKWINAYWALVYAKNEDLEIYKKSWNEKDEAWADRLWDAISVSDKWSSIYSANMIYTKLRSIGCSTEDEIDHIRNAMEDDMQALIYTEHNRWVTEELIAGFRPLLADEWEEYIETKDPKKKAERAHGNICSNALLSAVEPEAHEKDGQITLALLEIIEHIKKKK